MHQREQPFEQCGRRRRAAWDVKVDRNDGGNAAETGVAAGKETAVDRAAAGGDDPFRRGRRLIGPQQRLAHVFRHRPRDEKNVGMARRGHEAQTKSLEIVEGVGERVDLELAAVARSGVYFANGQTAPKSCAGGVIDLRREGREFGVVGAGRAVR